MKKIFMLATAAFLFSGVAFAQESGKKADCCKKTAKTECKKDCANKDCGTNCKKDGTAKNGKSCCSKEAKATSKTTTSTSTKKG